MKNKVLVVSLLSVILGCMCVLVFVGCSLFGCPGGNTSGGKDNCHFYSGASYYYQCTDNCITAQGTYISGTTYYFSGSKSCNCN